MAVELKVHDHLPLHGSAEINSKQSVNTVPGRFEGALSYDNLFQRGHSAGIYWFCSPHRPEQANIQSYNYNLPLGAPGDRLYLLYTHSDSNIPTPLGGATVSRGDTWRLRWRDELPAREGIAHGLTWGATWHHLRNANVQVAGATLSSPDLVYPTFQLGYDLTVQSALPGRESRLNTELSVSFPGSSRRYVDCSGTLREQFDCNRVTTTTPTSAAAPGAARPGFQVLTLTLSHNEPLGRWALGGKLQVQVSDTPLVPAEQVVYGGQDSVRGYYEGEQAGDYGAALRFELQPPAWRLFTSATLRALAFYDRAFVHKLYALPGDVATAQLGSTGFGLRLASSFGLQATLDWARLLFDTSRFDSANSSAAPLSGRDAGRGQRWSFTLRQAF